MLMPPRYIKQILRAYDRGGRKAASRMSQRTVARGLMRTLRGAAPLTSPGPPGTERSLQRSEVVP
jgi:hypothetical protein